MQVYVLNRKPQEESETTQWHEKRQNGYLSARWECKYTGGIIDAKWNVLEFPTGKLYRKSLRRLSIGISSIKSSSLLITLFFENIGIGCAMYLCHFLGFIER